MLVDIRVHIRVCPNLSPDHVTGSQASLTFSCSASSAESLKISPFSSCFTSSSKLGIKIHPSQI